MRQHRVILRFDAKGMSVPSAAGVFLQACSFNPIDFKRRQGDLKALRPEKAFPVVTGYDGAGVIEAVGDGVSHLQIGDEVYTRVVHDTQGTAAEYCLSYGTVTALKPRSFSFEEAAAVPLAAMTALQMLRKAKFARGHKVPLLHPPVADCKPLADSMVLPVAVWCAQVFVAAGAGGVGHYAIQIAKAMGAAHVVTTASGPKIELVKSLGADTVVVRRCRVNAAVPAPRCLCDFA
jgi:NADPH:quinone reductase-like Zn-dependent oxidoreductase